MNIKYIKIWPPEKDFDPQNSAPGGHKLLRHLNHKKLKKMLIHTEYFLINTKMKINSFLERTFLPSQDSVLLASHGMYIVRSRDETPLLVYTCNVLAFRQTLRILCTMAQTLYSAEPPTLLYTFAPYCIWNHTISNHCVL